MADFRQKAVCSLRHGSVRCAAGETLQEHEPTHHLEPIIAAKILLAQLNAPTEPANRFSKHFVLCALIACTGCSQGDI